MDIRSYLRLVAIGILAITISACANTYFHKPDVVTNTWKYSQFTDKVQRGEITKVRMSNDGIKVLAQTKDGMKALVNSMPEDRRQLFDALSKNNVEITIVPAKDFNR
ncbi:ATP-dependent metallopeptidase FtsH/Yme1/Tma family protein [Chamaesiphon sp.]|uniref:ATP-dependent metallopeptidase FtsH/Yme1/Tma family protein n=1 Tax=Chamaesiphon sp. TaxID=2814140 RepID=UPI00359367F0